MGIYQKMGRRWISLLLVFLMVFSLVPVDELMQVFAAEKPAITVGWKPQKKEVPSGENGEITLKVEIDPAQVEDVGLQIRLTEEEAAVYKRGRNAKSFTMAKNATMSDYRKATGFEALMGYLYLKDEFERLVELVKTGVEEMRLKL